MQKYIISILLGFALTSSITAASSSRKQSNGVPIGDTYYFWESEMPQDWSQALAYCKEEGGEIAKINVFNVYNILRLNLPDEGCKLCFGDTEYKLRVQMTENMLKDYYACSLVYWIDGKDKELQDRFTHNTDCTADVLNFDDIANLEFPIQSCLTLVKGANVANSRIEAVSCFRNQPGVICSIPVNDGCPAV